MSVHDTMAAWVKLAGQKMDENLRACAPPSVTKKQIAEMIEVHAMIRGMISGPLLSHLNSVEQALGLATQQIVELVGKLKAALTFLEFFPDLLSSDGTGVYVTVENAQDVAAWHADTAAWLAKFMENIQKSDDGQGD